MPLAYCALDTCGWEQECGDYRQADAAAQEHAEFWNKVEQVYP